MKRVRQIGDLLPTLARVREDARRVGFVPTMGALHAGHVSLLRESRSRGDFVVASIFVNPKQFGPSEDFTSYPRDIERDAALAEEAGADLLFAPDADEIYPAGFSTSVDVGSLGAILEGSSRPGHFRGVATVVLKLFHLVAPHTAYFGEKDAQQLAVIRRMVRDLHLPIEVVGLPTVRDPDGLAMSSRNVYLSAEERSAALRIPASLGDARDACRRGERSAVTLREIVLERLGRDGGVVLDYVALVDPATFALVGLVDREALLLIAARVGKTRLIDNMLLRAGGA
ncbi:MAG: pantoate--beta-alanine ligase [bacterium]